MTSSPSRPARGELGAFAPLLDSAGNSVKGQLVATFLSRRLRMDLFVSAPAERADEIRLT